MLKAKKYAYKKYIGNIHYLFLVRSLLLAIQTQSNIQFAVNLIIQFGDNLDITYLKATKCYELRSLELDNRTTLVLSNTRELDRVPSTK